MIPADYDVYKMSKSELRDYFLTTVPLLVLCGYVFYGGWMIPLITGCLSIFGLRRYRKALAEKQKNLLRGQFKDMLYSVASSVTSGRHLGEALMESERTVALIHGQESILAREIRNMVRIMQETNCSEETVLIDLASRSHLTEISDFTDVCITCRKTGGDLSRMIYKAVDILTDNIDLQKEKEVLLSQKKLESNLLAAMPVAVTGLVKISSSGYLDLMYTTLTGRVLMTIAFATTAFSWLWSRRLTDLDAWMKIR